ncbi:peptide alpha-N-acetyltransferase [Strigomonas culicis]|uniref:Peptide alpha-N-acetyltransferase n=1 Tax=Strigomonas culicis TaxID=28005 RepID=S9VBD8_9TRYP|nr:peptide alpha-N-acetyltransferase [Strigomonas culicis]EPY34714.1 peptide alpha-N-acetyltransferase [Strigomonas culicis]|eukprot:EPY24346.1 peptide alpha-N-acetyltransferase [Strigomonas culicis]
MAEPVKLPDQQRRLFDRMSREFDNREYAKSLRTCESILSVAPDHADTVAMHGLILHNLSRKSEAYETIKRAIALFPRSTIAWHALGMCRRTDQDYSAALKAFKQASLTDPSNSNVLRDLAAACVQLRDWEQFLSVREKMVTSKAGVRANWIALSCGHYMLGNYKLAAAVMEVMTNIMDAGENPVEVSEAYLYRVELELLGGAPHKALEILKKHDAELVDYSTKLLLRAKAHAQLGQKEEAEKRYLELIEKGYAEGDCLAAIALLRKIPLDAAHCPRQQVDKYVELVDSILAGGRRPYAERHILDCVPVEQLRPRLLAYVKPYITRMIPSLFSVLKSLYKDPARAQVVGEVFLQLLAELEAKDFATSFGGEADPTYILWVYMYLATHYRRVGDHAQAHHYIDKAIAHTPTLEILYLEKARIYQAEGGKTVEAAAAADTARLLDLQDKYLNTEAAKFFLRNNDIEKAEETMQLFYKDAIVKGDTYLVALESQCSWYEVEVGEAFYRKGDYVSALQNLLMFELHHKQNHCELNDFHNYVFRRNTMRTWFDVLHNDDHMEENKFFLQFCPGLVRTYMKVDELGEAAVRAAHVPRPELSLEGLSADDTKRITQLQEEYCIQDIDLSQPLEKAERYMGYLLQHRSHAVATHTLAVEFYTHAKKPLLVARALYALHKLHHANMETLKAAFEQGLLAASRASMDARVLGVVEEVLAAM